MKTVDVIKGLQILQKYRSSQDGYDLVAEHDILYVYCTDHPVAGKDLKILADLGWFQEDADYDGGEEFKPEYYDFDQGWSCYV